MGGKAQRFGLKFKPFLKIFDKTFLELAIQPFLKHKNNIKEMIFLTTEEQCEEFNIQYRIKSFNLPVSWLIYSTKTTDGIIPDINKLIGERSGLNDVIFCDCDHTLNVDDMMEVIQKSNYDIVLPVWPIDSPEKWSVVVTDDNDIVIDIAEKEYPTLAGYPHGVIGCYYFKRYPIDTEGKRKYISEVILTKVQFGRVAKVVHIKEAEFFGDPERLKQLYEEKKASTIFCDLDGTIIEHESEPDFSSITLLEGAGEKIEQWRCDNCFIVLTTSRDEQFRPEMEKLLREAGIRYEILIMGLPPGTRHLINDKKPYADAPMAVGHNVIRNEGIKNLELGNSLATLERKEQRVLKILPENTDAYQVKKFESQYYSMLKISQSEIGYLVPDIGTYANGVYDMEHLNGYVGLHQVENKVAALEVLFESLPKLYADKVKCANDWLNWYIGEKIYSKKDVIKKLGLDAAEIYERLEDLTIEEYNLYSPNYLSSVHGDMTYENIMCKEIRYSEIVSEPNYSIKLIDFDNDNKFQPREQDLGKLWQSADAGYERWGKDGILVNQNELHCIAEFYAEQLGKQKHEIFKIAQFYCSLHLFRMIPYQYKRSPERANIALRTCKTYLNL